MICFFSKRGFWHSILWKYLTPCFFSPRGSFHLSKYSKFSLEYAHVHNFKSAKVGPFNADVHIILYSASNLIRKISFFSSQFRLLSHNVASWHFLCLPCFNVFIYFSPAYSYLTYYLPYISFLSFMYVHASSDVTLLALDLPHLIYFSYWLDCNLLSFTHSFPGSLQIGFAKHC